MMTRGCLFGLAVLAALFAVAIHSVATWHQSANAVSVALETTEQVRIIETEATKRTQIVTDGNVEIARIQADATKKTDATFILFYLIRAGVWIIVILLIVFLVLVAVGIHKREYRG